MFNLLKKHNFKSPLAIASLMDVFEKMIKKLILVIIKNIHGPEKMYRKNVLS
jgi:hypothetical protein